MIVATNAGAAISLVREVWIKDKTSPPALKRIKIYNNIRNVGGGGIWLGGHNQDQVKRVTLKDITIANNTIVNARCGISVVHPLAQNIVARNNIVWDVTGIDLRWMQATISAKR